MNAIERTLENAQSALGPIWYGAVAVVLIAWGVFCLSAAGLAGVFIFIFTAPFVLLGFSLCAPLALAVALTIGAAWAAISRQRP